MSKLENNTTNLQSILNTINNLPSAGSGAETCTVTINNVTSYTFDMCISEDSRGWITTIAAYPLIIKTKLNSIIVIRYSGITKNLVTDLFDSSGIEEIAAGSFSYNMNEK